MADDNLPASFSISRTGPTSWKSLTVAPGSSGVDGRSLRSRRSAARRQGTGRRDTATAPRSTAQHAEAGQDARIDRVHGRADDPADQ